MSKWKCICANCYFKGLLLLMVSSPRALLCSYCGAYLLWLWVFFSVDIILFPIAFLPTCLKYHFIRVQVSILHLTVRFKLLNQTPSIDSKDNSSRVFFFNFSAFTLPEQHLIHTFPSRASIFKFAYFQF